MAKSNEVLEANFDHIKETLSRIENRFSEKLDNIEKQVIKTNGRVTTLETWRERLRGGTMVVRVIWGVFGTFFLGFFIHLYNVISDIDQKVATEVATKFEEYEFIITE